MHSERAGEEPAHHPSEVLQRLPGSRRSRGAFKVSPSATRSATSTPAPLWKGPALRTHKGDELYARPGSERQHQQP